MTDTGEDKRECLLVITPFASAAVKGGSYERQEEAEQGISCQGRRVQA